MIYDDFPFLKPHSSGKHKNADSTWNKLKVGFESITHIITKGAFRTSTKEYAGCLRDLFKETYFIEDYINQDPDDKLAYISQFLHEVVLSLALEDIKFLMAKYLEISKEASLLQKHDKEKLNILQN